MRFNKEERSGIYSIAKVFVEELEWVFREQPINDFGIDAIVESTVKTYSNYQKSNASPTNSPTGNLLALQIKSGDSYFKECSNAGIIFRGKEKHLKYWINYSVQVVLVLHSPSHGISYWQVINNQTITKTKSAWKIVVPWKNTLDKECESQLSEIASYKNEYEQKLSLFRTCEGLINELIEEEERFLYIGVWERTPSNNESDYIINLVFSDVKDEMAAREFDSGGYYFWNYLISHKANLSDSIKRIIPWADLYYEGNPFSEKGYRELLIEQVSDFSSQASEVLPSDYITWSCAKLMCHFTGEDVIMLELRANKLARSFIELNAFLTRTDEHSGLNI